MLNQYIRSYPPYLVAVPPSATWGRAMKLWQGATNREPYFIFLIFLLTINGFVPGGSGTTNTKTRVLTNSLSTILYTVSPYTFANLHCWRSHYSQNSFLILGICNMDLQINPGNEHQIHVHHATRLSQLSELVIDSYASKYSLQEKRNLKYATSGRLMWR
jgi:hypothetical protein